MSVHRKGVLSLSHICLRQPQEATIVKTALGSPKEIEDVFAKCSSKVPEVPTKLCICTWIENLLVQL
jgi:hypothetical protein